MQTAQTTPARSNARKAASPVEPSTTEHSTFLNHEIAQRAYEIYLARGAEHGHDVEDWIAAEREILEGGDGSASYPE
jgi:hypothetical protein